MHRFQAMWDSLRSSLWFLPTVINVGAVGLALALIEVDTHLERDEWSRRLPLIFGAGASGARGMLSAIASSMITVAGVAFSITIVALSLASSQYTSRILRTFMRDRANQIILGVFTGVFAYCLIVLRTVRGGDEGAFVPSLAVSFAVALAFVAIGILIFFIHHISLSIQATSIIKAAADETIGAIDNLFPEDLGESADAIAAAELKAPPDSQLWRPVQAVRTGYILGVDGDALFRLAREQSVIIRMERGVGEFVVEGSPIVSILGACPFGDETVKQLNGAFTIGHQRTMVQDAGFGIRQIVDVALKALSPGVNDTTTAVICVDFLSAIFARLAARRIETPYRAENGELRVVARGPTFQDLLGEGFDQIRQNSPANVTVLLALVRALDVIAGRTRDPERRMALRRHLDWIVDASRRSIAIPHDREMLETAFERLAGILENG